jgi:hypothetical protein
VRIGHRQLAERIEGLVSQEHAKRTASHQQARAGSQDREAARGAAVAPSVNVEWRRFSLLESA